MLGLRGFLYSTISLFSSQFAFYYHLALYLALFIEFMFLNSFVPQNETILRNSVLSREVCFHLYWDLLSFAGYISLLSCSLPAHLSKTPIAIVMFIKLFYFFFILYMLRCICANIPCALTQDRKPLDTCLAVSVTFLVD